MGHELEKAIRILNTSRTHSYSDGELIVHTLLNGRTQEELSLEELRILAKGYNWWGRHEEARDAMMAALTRQPSNLDLLVESIVYISNASNANTLLESYDQYITAGLGPSWFWRIQKAAGLTSIATGEAELEDYTWIPGNEILHTEALDQAIEELMQAMESVPRESMEWFSKSLEDEKALTQSPRFAELLMKLHST